MHLQLLVMLQQIPGEGGGQAVKIEAVELRTVRLPLVAPFRTSQHSQDERVALLVCAHTTAGECQDLPLGRHREFSVGIT